MLEEIGKVLGPWPILQFMFGVAVLGFGVYMIVRGQSSKKHDILIEDKRAEWKAHENLDHIAENSFKIVENQRRIEEKMNYLGDQVKALAAAIWNRGV